jgi:large subunit ribosomal protein L29
MASKRYTELHGMAVEAIQGEITAAKQDLARMMFDHAAKGIENPLAIGETRKEIARMLTELRAREIAALNPDQVSKRSKIRLRRK